MSAEPPVTRVAAEPVTPHDAGKLAHLGAHRGLIIRRSLLIGAIRGFFPVPMVDEQIAGVGRIHQARLLALVEHAPGHDLLWRDGFKPRVVLVEHADVDYAQMQFVQ